MSVKAERAVSLFADGASCSQSVFVVFCKDYGLTEEDAMRLASPMGGGMCVAQMCGAATGGMLVVGAKYGTRHHSDKDGKKVCKQHGAEFMKKFHEFATAYACADILGHDITTAEGFAAAKPLLRTRCKDLVRLSVEALESLGY